MNHYDIYRDQLAITHPSSGHALWEPAPEVEYGPVKVGDVGYPVDHESHKDTSLPEYHEPLIPNIPNHIFRGTRKPDHYCSAGVNAEPAKPDYLSQGPQEFTEASFSCRRRRGGAVLSLPVDSQREDTRARGDFGKWMLKNIDCWFAFARGLGLGIERMEEIILVTGCDCTKSWANVAFLEGQPHKMAIFGFKVIQGRNVSIHWQFLSGNRQGAVCNWGPEGQNLREDQCVFIRGYRVRRILGMRQLKGAAGPESSLDGDHGDELGKELISIPTSMKYMDPLYALLDHIVERAPNCDMALVHDDDLSRIGRFHDGNGALQPELLMSHLQRTQPEIQQIPCEKHCPPTNESNSKTETITVAMFSQEFQEWGQTPQFTILGVIRDLVLTISSTLYKLVSVERHHMIFFAVVFIEAALLKYIGRSDKGVYSAITLTLLGRLVWPVWSSLKRLHRRLDEVFARIDALQQSIKSLESTVARPPIPILARAEPSMPVYECPIVPPMVTNEPPQPYDISSPERLASSSTSRPTSATEPDFSRWIPALREIKRRIQQFSEDRIERISHLDQVHVQSEPDILLSVRRWTVRLLMSAASLSPANFASPVGYLGPIKSTPYYPTGDIFRDRSVAFTTAMDCLDELEVDLDGNHVRTATKLFRLAQALSDLGLRDYALNISDYALDALERLYITEPDQSRLHVASVLSLRANILCDLKRNDEARDAADSSVTLCREHQDSQTGSVPELAYSLLNYAVVLDFIGLKDESAAIAFELWADDSRSDMEDISALCELCFSNTRIEADDDLAFSMVEEVIESTRSSPSANSQAVLAGALLNKSKILSSRGQKDAACSFSAETVVVLRTIVTGRPVFSLFLAHALDTHAHHLSEANRKEGYSIRRDAVELWQTLKISAGEAVARPLAWSSLELAKFCLGSDRNARREKFRIAESTVGMFRQVEPLDAPGLGNALYLYANRMLELDNNREAATYAEESVHYFQEASSKDSKYALDLIFSLSLASSCLSCTERANDAFEYAKQAVKIQHERKCIEDEQYNTHLQKLLVEVVLQATELDKQEEAFPWFQELQALSGLGESSYPLQRQSGNSRGKDDESKKQMSHWMTTNTKGPRVRISTSRSDKGKVKEVDLLGGLPGLGGTGSPSRTGPGMGGRTLGGLDIRDNRHGRSLAGRLGDMGGWGGLGRLGPDGQGARVLGRGRGSQHRSRSL